MRASLFAVAVLAAAAICACEKTENAGPDKTSSAPVGKSSASPGGAAAGCDVTLDAAKGEVKVEEGKRYCFAGATFTRDTTPEEVEKMTSVGPCKSEGAVGGSEMVCSKLKLQFSGPKPWLTKLQAL